MQSGEQHRRSPHELVVDGGRWRARAREETESIWRLTIDQDGRRLRFSELIDLWAWNRDFAIWFSSALAAAAPFQQYYWECPPLTCSLENDLAFECAFIRRSNAFAAANPRDFREHLNAAEAHVGAVTFRNLGGDSQLVAPCERGSRSCYGHLASFVNLAPEEQQWSLWSLVGQTVRQLLKERGKRPTWISTEGSGVPWLHVRLDTRPKYYHHNEYLDFVRT